MPSFPKRCLIMGCIIGTLKFILQIPNCNSLKAKRSIIKRLTARIKKRFNVAVAEIDLQDVKDRASLAAVSVSSDISYLNGQLDLILNFIDREHSFVLENHQIEFY